MSEKNNKPIFKKWWVILIVLIVIVAIASVGNSNKKTDDAKETASTSDSSTDTASKDTVDTAAPSESKTEDETSKNKDTKITYENFLNIKMGQSYDQVVALIGEGKESSSDETAGKKTVMYEWNDSGMGNIDVTIEDGVVVAKAQAFLKESNANMTMDLYNKVENGMTYDQVKAIIGEGELASETKIMDYDAKMYSYINKDGSNANFTFTNDSMESKVQLNLN